MIKIIHFTSWRGVGGGPAVVFEIVRGLRDEFDFSIAAPLGVFLKEFSEMGVRVREFGKESPIERIRERKKILQKENPDVLHFHGTRAAFWGRLAIIGLKNRPRTVYTLHGFHIIRRKFFLKWPLVFLERFLNRYTDALVCVSENDRDLVVRYRTAPPQKVKTIRNGVDIEKFQVCQEEIKKTRQELDLGNKFVLCSVGRLEPPKDFSTVLKALQLVIPRVSDMVLLIVGDGSLRELLEKETKDLGLNSYVRFLGFQGDVPILISLSDIAILSTRWEGLPLVPLEFGSCEKPIIASDVGGVREAVIDGETGLLFQPGSAEDLAEKILKLYRSEELRKRMGKAALVFVSENFSKERMVREYEDLYKELTNENTSSK